MVNSRMSFKFCSSGLSDVGLVRSNNEDAWGEVQELSFYVLADGMGGHKAGEVAAQLAVDSLCQWRRDISSSENIEEQLLKAIGEANIKIFDKGQADQDLSGMGTTLCCLLFCPDKVVVAHIGDSRIYCFREGTLNQLTEDHSLLNELIRKGHMDKNGSSSFAYKNVITKAMGVDPIVVPSIDQHSFQAQDLFLICSDGLSDCLSHQQIHGILSASCDINSCAKNLIDSAKEVGGQDNITVLLVKVK